MSGALEIAAVGLRAHQRALETIAGNIANVNTPSYKRADIKFAELVGGLAVSGAHPNQKAAEVPAFLVVNGIRAWSTAEIDRQGMLDVTGNALDLAIDGAGFVELMGPAGRSLLWRGGTLRILDDGSLATEAGFPLRAGILAPRDAVALRIERDGTVFAQYAGERGDDEIGRIALVRAGDDSSLTRLDGGVYESIQGADLVEMSPGEDGLGYIVQGSLERSNVELNEEMVELLIAQRAYAASAQVVRAADEFLSLANNLRRS